MKKVIFYNSILSLLLVLSTVFAFSGSAFAQNNHPYRAKIYSPELKDILESGKTRKLLRISTSMQGVRFKGIIKKQPNAGFHLSLNDDVTFSATQNSLVNYSGTVKSDTGEIAIALTVDHLLDEVRIEFNSQLHSRGEAKSFVLDYQGSSLFRVRRKPEQKMRDGSCAAHLTDAVIIESSENADTIEAAAESGTINLVLLADYAFYRQYRDRSSFELTSSLNAVNAIYNRDIGTSFNLLGVIVVSSRSRRAPFRSRNALELLDDVVRFSRENLSLPGVDMVHLVSGKDIYDTSGGQRIPSVAGIAYVGTFCDEPSLARGLNEDASPSLRRVLMAHELGHVLNATHGESGFGTSGVMSSRVGSNNDFFSAFSQNEIGQHLLLHNDCIEDNIGIENVFSSLDAESSVNLKKKKLKRRTKLTSVVRNSTGLDITGNNTTLFYRRRKNQPLVAIRTKATNGAGRAVYRVRKKGFYSVQSSSGLLSREVRIR